MACWARAKKEDSVGVEEQSADRGILLCGLLEEIVSSIGLEQRTSPDMHSRAICSPGAVSRSIRLWFVREDSDVSRLWSCEERFLGNDCFILFSCHIIIAYFCHMTVVAG